MIARREPLGSADAAVVSDQYVVAFGKSGGLGCFTVVEPMDLLRGERVVLRTPRGQEIGAVLGPATLRQARLIGSQVSGDILRRAAAADELAQTRLRPQADALFEECRRAARGLPLQILDVEVLLDGAHAIAQFVGGSADDVASLTAALPARQLTLRFENLAMPPGLDNEGPVSGGCGKPDCGRIDGGGCTTCGAGGGCSTCGAGHVDLRPYFAHLRDKMEASQRMPLA